MLINECTSDLRNGLGRRLYDLASMIDSVAECQSDSYLHILPSSIGYFAQQILASRSMIMIPVLPDEIRAKHTSLVNVAAEQGIKSLEEIKRQLCDNENIDYKKLMESAGALTRHGSKLNSERRSLTPRGGSGSDEE
jgi:hypothetical protein